MVSVATVLFIHFGLTGMNLPPVGTTPPTVAMPPMRVPVA